MIVPCIDCYKPVVVPKDGKCVCAQCGATFDVIEKGAK